MFLTEDNNFYWSIPKWLLKHFIHRSRDGQGKGKVVIIFIICTHQKYCSRPLIDLFNDSYLCIRIPPLSNSVRKWRLQFAGHCLRASDQPVSCVLFWTPSEGHSSCGRRSTTYPNSISKDLDLEPNEVQQLMLDKLAWKKFVTTASNIPSKDDRWWWCM